MSKSDKLELLKEYEAQHAWLVAAEPALRMITDVMTYCAEHVPLWNTISVTSRVARTRGASAPPPALLLGAYLAPAFLERRALR